LPGTWTPFPTLRWKPRRRRVQDALEEEGRGVEGLPHGVEAVGGCVGGEQGGEVEVHAEQVPQGVGVLGPVEAPQDGAAVAAGVGWADFFGGISPKRTWSKRMPQASRPEGRTSRRRPFLGFSGPWQSTPYFERKAPGPDWRTRTRRRLRSAYR
jgi:hypothetical protein